MDLTSACIVCGGTNLDRFPAAVSEFLAHYVWGRTRMMCTLLRCAECETWFYDLRPDASEMVRLYTDYRGSRYCRLRESFEPGYRRLNGHLGIDLRELRARHEHLIQALTSIGFRLRPEHRCLDYGGDRGQQYPPSFHIARLFVFDVSGADPLEGVRGLSKEALEPHGFDLVICNHVLEHLSSPRDVVREISGLLAPGGLAYFEVPSEAPRHAVLWARRLVRAAVGEPVAAHLDEHGTSILTAIPSLHEHINFFNRRSLARLIKAGGLDPLRTDSVQLDLGWTRTRIASVVARAPSTT